MLKPHTAEPNVPIEDGCVGMPMTATVLGVFDKDLNELNYGESGELCMTGPSMMLHYSGWRGEELTEQTLVEHPDGTHGYIQETRLISQSRELCIFLVVVKSKLMETSHFM